MKKHAQFNYIFVMAVCLLTNLFLAYGAANAEPSTKLKIAFHGRSDSGIRIYLAGLDGKATSIADRDFAMFPSFSPDGNILYFEGMGPSVFLAEEFELNAVNPEGSEPVKKQEDDFELAEIYQIFKMDLISNKVVQISDGKNLDSHPACSPDGKSIAFCSKPALPDDKKNVEPWRIYIMDSDGKNRRLLEASQDKNQQVYPSWSPDGQKIVYVDKSTLKLEGTEMTIPLSVLKVKDVKGGASVDLLSTFYYADEPAWSPSGDKIAFSALDPKTTIKTIWLTTVDGKKIERVTDGPYDEHPAWHPDGTDSKILFARRAAPPTKDKKTSAGIYFLELTSGKTVEFYQSDDESYGFPQVFRPKGKTTTK